MYNAINWTNSPRFVRRKLFADSGRIARKPPRSTSEDDTPGLLCWGVVGDLPSAEPVPTTDFNVETHTEISRETTAVRIENPDDPEQHVNVDQTDSMTLKTTVPAEKNNSATEGADLSQFEDRVQSAIKETGSGTREKKYEMRFYPPDRAI
jgi:hypothetical protein